jgi:hypothetical protein
MSERPIENQERNNTELGPSREDQQNDQTPPPSLVSQYRTLLSCHGFLLVLQSHLEVLDWPDTESRAPSICILFLNVTNLFPRPDHRIVTAGSSLMVLP